MSMSTASSVGTPSVRSGLMRRIASVAVLVPILAAAALIPSLATEPAGAATPAAAAPHAASHGYWLVGRDGGIFSFGAARFYGSTGGLHLQRPVMGVTPSVNHKGYWLVAADGGIFAFGSAGFYGSIPGIGIKPAGAGGRGPKLNKPVVGIVPSSTGHGYFMVASDGGVFAFGDAHFEGSCPGIGGCIGAAKAVVPDASGNGYWLVTDSGHVYAFGNAQNFGQPGTKPVLVTSAERTPSGRGYWILYSDGIVFRYGDAPNYGSLPAGSAGGYDIATAIFSTAGPGGYWIVTAAGAVYSFGKAPYEGGMSGRHLNGFIIGATGW
jgi:hypothetical protein